MGAIIRRVRAFEKAIHEVSQDASVDQYIHRLDLTYTVDELSDVTGDSRQLPL